MSMPLTSDPPSARPTGRAPEPAPAAPASPAPSQDSAWVLYGAAAFGAFCLGLGDLLNNSNAATVLKLGEILRQHLWPSLTSSGTLALVMLVLLGGGVCWLQQPRTRNDAFVRGFSVFAILAVTAPYQAPSADLGDPGPGGGGPNPVTGLSSFTAPVPTFGWALAQNERPRGQIVEGRAVVQIVEADGRTPVNDVLVTLRQTGTAQVMGSETVQHRVTIRKDPGSYWVEVEKSGYRRVRFRLTLTGDGTPVLRLRLPRSRVPLNLQRLGSPEEVRPQVLRGGGAARA